MSSKNEWPMVKLGEIAEIGTAQVKPESLDGETVYLGLEHLKKNGGILETSDVATAELKSSKYAFTEEAILFGKLRPNLRKIAVPNFSGVCSTDILPIYSSEKVNRSFLYHYLLSESPQAYIQNRVTGINLPRTSPKALRELQVPLPPLAEQQRIADILDTSAEVIHKEEYLQRSILPLVINIVEKKVASPDSTLGNLIESMSSGKNVAESPDPNQQNRVLKVSAVTSGTFKPAESKPLPDTYLPPKTHQVRKGDILVSRANTTELLGASALVENDVESLYLPDKIWRVTPKDGVDPDLLWGILQTKTVRARISQRATGSSGSMKNISQKNFLQVPCATFSRSESVKLAALIREAVSVHHQIAQKLTLLRSLHHSLSTRAFAGQL